MTLVPRVPRNNGCGWRAPLFRRSGSAARRGNDVRMIDGVAKFSFVPSRTFSAGKTLSQSVQLGAITRIAA